MEKADLNRFELLCKIGTGAFGTVYKAREKGKETIYAVKITHKCLDEEENINDTILNIVREVNILCKLNHPSIIKFIGFSPQDFKGNTNPVLITEYIPNGSLSKYIKQECQGITDPKYSATQKLKIMYGIASAMSYLHSHNVIHRDLKPDNILVDENLNPRIADFGLSKINHHNKNSMSMISAKGMKGTLVYIPPEIFEDWEFSKEGDIYAFAMIAYEIYMTKQPFEGFSLPKLIMAVSKGERPIFDTSVPYAYRSLIERCWSQEPSKRPQFDAIVGELKENPEFITDLVEKEEYIDYIEFIDAYETTYDSERRILTYEEFIKRKEDKEENPDEDLVITENSIIYKLSKKEKKAEIFQSIDENKEIEIPKFIEHKSELYKIVQINSEAFLYSTIEVFKMINDENITISPKSFENCVSLRSITIETNGTIHIEENNFNKILKLESINIKGKHILIDSNCFTECFVKEQYFAKQQKQSENKIIIIEGTNQISIGNACFKKNDMPEQIKLKSKQITIGDNCFDECNYLSLFTISGSNEFSLGKNQFRKCIHLQNFELKSTKIYLGIKCFSLSSLNKVEIFGDEITIDKFSFSDLLSITEFSIKESKNVKIKEKAFVGCKNLKIFSVVSEQSLSVSNSCFINLTSLQEIFIACPTIFIDESCFMNCKSLSSIKFDKTNKYEISDQAFSGCESLKELSIISYLKAQIKQHCFSGCKNLSSIKLLSEEIIIDEFCFENCSSLLSLTFPEVRILDIKANSFKNCINLSKITVERSEVVHFGQFCFNKASNLSSIDINTNQLTIDENCFYQCESLRSLIFDKVKNAVFNPCSFKECSNIRTISIKNASSLYFSEKWFIYNKNISSIDIQSDEIKFNNKFINSCPYLTKIKLSSVQNSAITQDTFSECTSLSNIEINSENSLDLSEKCFNNSKNINQITFKSNKININTECFSYATNLQYVTINCSELTIGEGSFKNCSKLSSIALSNIQNLLIRKKAFSGFSKLTNITFKAQKNINLGDSCFFGSMNLEYIILDSEEVEIHDSCFKGCKNLTSIAFKNVQKAFIGSNSFDQCPKLRIIDISTTSRIKLNDYCFNGANSLDSVTLSSKVIEIGQSCFKNCKYLSNIQLHDTDDLTIGYDAFYRCESLQDITITVKSNLTICNYCFSGANNLNTVSLSGNSLLIGDYIFKDCPSLISASFKSSSKSQISDKAFYNSQKTLKLDLSMLNE